MRAADKMRRVCGAVALLAFLSSVRAAEDRPNIVVFVVDDLDNHMGSLDHMQFVQKRLVDQGLVFENAVVTTALCCPTRTTFLTGLLAHSSNYTSTMDPFGGYEPFWTRGFVNDYLPTWLKDAGYKTWARLFSAKKKKSTNLPRWPQAFYWKARQWSNDT